MHLSTLLSSCHLTSELFCQQNDCQANRYDFNSRQIVRSQQLDRANDQAVNSRLLVQRQKMHGPQKCCSELAELTVDNIWQITDANDQELGRLAHRLVTTASQNVVKSSA